MFGLQKNLGKMIFVSAYLWFCLLETPRSSGIKQWNTRNNEHEHMVPTRSWFPEHHSSLKDLGPLGEMVDLRMGTDNVQNGTEKYCTRNEGCSYRMMKHTKDCQKSS